MDLATKVNIILCILSFILALISIITVIITLRQNQQMLENSSRPMCASTSITFKQASPPDTL